MWMQVKDTPINLILHIHLDRWFPRPSLVVLHPVWILSCYNCLTGSVFANIFFSNDEKKKNSKCQLGFPFSYCIQNLHEMDRIHTIMHINSSTWDLNSSCTCIFGILLTNDWNPQVITSKGCIIWYKLRLGCHEMSHLKQRNMEYIPHFRLRAPKRESSRSLRVSSS